MNNFSNGHFACQAKNDNGELFFDNNLPDQKLDQTIPLKTTNSLARQTSKNSLVNPNSLARQTDVFHPTRPRCYDYARQSGC